MKRLFGAMFLPLQMIAGLLATGWPPPIPFTMKARDGVTDLFGLMCKPTNFDSSSRYRESTASIRIPKTRSVGCTSFAAGEVA